jgi:16S rRNA (cytosine1402-N4)-methyltransferase
MSLTTSLPTHIPVLLNEAIEGLQAEPGGCFVDCTVGMGGHAAAILEKVSTSGRLLGIDVDPEAITAAQAKLSGYGEVVTLVNENFVNLEAICMEYHFYPVDGILFDLGVSSVQLDTAQRGFSFHLEAPLDMRFDPRQRVTAGDIVNTSPEKELVRIIEEYGEERHPRRLARHIVRSRPITTTSELARVVEQVLGGKRARIHPATRTFMALRIAVNNELQNLESALKQAIGLLRPGGRLVAISYHSLEDRIVKELMRREATSYEHVPALKLISKKVIKPSLAEVESNPRSRSAKLRIAERLQ